MERHQGRANGKAGVALVMVLLLAGSAVAEENSRERIRETQGRIEAVVGRCEAALKADGAPPIDELREAMKSLASDAEGLKALAKYLDHKRDYVAVLAVRAIGEAPKALALYSGKLLTARLTVRYFRPDRRLVYLESVRAVGRTGYLGAGPVLLKALDRLTDPIARKAAVEAIGEIGDPRSIRTLHARLSSGTSVNLRGPNVGTGRRSRAQNPREQTGLGGAKNNRTVQLGGGFVETVEADSQPVDEDEVVNTVYAVLSELLDRQFTSWHTIDRYLRDNNAELKKAVALTEKKAREQEREIARMRR